MTWNDHDHRGEYAEERHDHDNDYAGKHHRHYDLERDTEGARGQIDALRQVIDLMREHMGELSRGLDDALGRIADLEKQTPQARQLQLEADLAAADLAESGYDRHGRDCQCSYCATDEEPEHAEYDPGPEVDDEGGMSEYRYHEPEPWQ